MTPLDPATDDELRAAPAPATAGRDRVIGGVAGLFGARLGVDALWIRLLFVLLALAHGVGLVLYAGLWLALVAGATVPFARVVGAVVTIGVLPLVVAATGVGFVDGPVAIVLLLVGLTAALWAPRTRVAPIGSAPAWAPPDDVPSHWSAPHQAEAASSSAQASPSPRETSPLGRVTLGAALVVGAVWALADQLDGGRLHPEQWFGGAAAVCGVGLLVGAFVGRARWLVLPALLLAVTGYVGGQFARLGIDGGDGFGDHYLSVGTYTDATSITEHVGLGELQVVVESEPAQQVHVDARVAIGSIRVAIPASVTVEVRARTDSGTVRTDAGQVLGDTSTTTFGPDGPPAVVIDAWVGRGDIHITEWIVGASRGPGDMPVMPPLGLVETTTTLVPPQAGDLVVIRDGVSMTTDGWVVLGEGSAVISPDDVVTVTIDGGLSVSEDGSQQIETPWGPFRLLPRSLLLTPDLQVIDLQALREQVAAAANAPSTPPVATLPG